MQTTKTFFSLVTLLAVALFVLPSHTVSASNKQINFQGKLVNLDGTNISDGTYNMQFKIYCGGDGDSVGAGTGADCTHVENEDLLWTETRLNNNSQGVTVTDGIFRVSLGSITAFGSSIDWDEDEIWLTTEIGNTNGTCTPFTNCSPDGEMDPMVRFTASPYALNSDQLDGLDSTDFIRNQTGQQASSNFNISGTGVAGTALQAPSFDVASAGTLSIGASTATALTIAKTGVTSTFQGRVTVNEVFTVGNGAGNDYLGFIAEGSNPACAAGQYRIWANSTDTTLKKCQNGTVTDLDTGGGGDLQSAYNNDSAGEADIITTSTAKKVLIRSGSTFDTSNVFHVQNAASNDVFGVDTSANQAVLGQASTLGGRLVVHGGTSGNVAIDVPATITSWTLTLPSAVGSDGQCLKANGGSGDTTWGSCGGGGGVTPRRITLVPDYPGAVFTADGAGNSGTMTSDFCSGTSRKSVPATSNPCGATEEHNYYTWTSTDTNAADYDIWIRYQLPSDFNGFSSSTSINMFGWRTDATSNAVDLSLFQANGTQCGSTTNVATGTATWTETALTGDETACTFAANDVVIFKVKVTSANSTKFVRAGAIRFDYASL